MLKEEVQKETRLRHCLEDQVEEMARGWREESAEFARMDRIYEQFERLI